MYLAMINATFSSSNLPKLHNGIYARLHPQEYKKRRPASMHSYSQPLMHEEKTTWKKTDPLIHPNAHNSAATSVPENSSPTSPVLHPQPPAPAYGGVRSSQGSAGGYYYAQSPAGATCVFPPASAFGLIRLCSCEICYCGRPSAE